MDNAVEQQKSRSSQTVSKIQPIVKWAQDISEWAKNFFTFTDKEKKAAGICDYKNDHL